MKVAGWIGLGIAFIWVMIWPLFDLDFVRETAAVPIVCTIEGIVLLIGDRLEKKKKPKGMFDK